MFARVIPCRRLPRGLNIFDYVIPTELVGKIVPGLVVGIPFHHQKILGVVWEIVESSIIPLKQQKFLWALPEHCTVDARLRSVVDQVAARYGVSVGTLLQQSVFAQRLRFVNALSQDDTSTDNVSTADRVVYARQSERRAWLQTLVKQHQGTKRVLIITPTRLAAMRVAQGLPGALLLERRTALQYAELLSLLNTATIFVGTRSSAIAPLPHLATIVIDDEGHVQYQPTEQQPRSAIWPLFSILAKVHGARLVALSPAPSVAAWAVTTSVPLDEPKAVSATIRLFPYERRGGKTTFISDSLSIHLQTAFNARENIFVVLNRRGDTRLLTCAQCGWESRCPSC